MTILYTLNYKTKENKQLSSYIHFSYQVVSTSLTTVSHTSSLFTSPTQNLFRSPLLWVYSPSSLTPVTLVLLPLLLLITSSVSSTSTYVHQCIKTTLFILRQKEVTEENVTKFFAAVIDSYI